MVLSCRCLYTYEPRLWLWHLWCTELGKNQLDSNNLGEAFKSKERNSPSPATQSSIPTLLCASIFSLLFFFGLILFPTSFWVNNSSHFTNSFQWFHFLISKIARLLHWHQFVILSLCNKSRRFFTSLLYGIPGSDLLFINGLLSSLKPLHLTS